MPDIPVKKIARLGEGAFGTVWLIRHTHLRGEFAMKEIRAEWAGSASILEQFSREAELWIALGRHPNLVNAQVVSRNVETGSPIIVMEYVAPDEAGRTTMEDHFQRAYRSYEMARWVIQCCDGLEFARANGIACHRDIKPGNILISQAGQAKVGDFGLAVFRGLGLNGTASAAPGTGFAGTLPYMAPEQFDARARVGPASDIYAFGVILYRLVANRFPIAPQGRDPNPGAWLSAHSHQLPVRLDSPLWPIIARCLAKEPGDRYQSYNDLREALNDRLTQIGYEPVPVPTPPAPTASDWNNKGNGLRALDRPQEALTCFRQAVLMEPMFAKAWANLGACLAALDRDTESRECYDRALELDASLGLVWSARAHDHYLARRWEEALACYDRAVAVEPEDPFTWHDRAFPLRLLSRWTDAIESLRKAVKLSPGLTRARIHLAEFLGQAGRGSEALAVYDALLAHHPSADVFTRRGEQLYRLENWQSAYESFASAVRIDPTFAQAHYGLGTTEIRRGNLAPAVAHLCTAVRLNEKDARAWHFLADVQRQLGALEEASEAYRRCLELAPDRASVWSDAGATLDRLGRRGEAHVYYREALRLAPDDWGTWWNRALLEVEVGLHREAAESYCRFLACAPPEHTDGIAYATAWLRARSEGT